MGFLLTVLAVLAAFIGTLFVFRAADKLHAGEAYTYEAVTAAVCAAVIVLALCCRARRMPAGAALLYAVLAMPLGVACSRVLF